MVEQDYESGDKTKKKLFFTYSELLNRTVGFRTSATSSAMVGPGL